MNSSISWTKAYVPDLDCTAQEYMDAMTLSGTKVEGYTELDKNLDKIVVGKINKIEKHPDADKLVICQVQIDEAGTEVQIVTGAPNVKEGDKVGAGGPEGGSCSQQPQGWRVREWFQDQKRKAQRSGFLWDDVFH